MTKRKGIFVVVVVVVVCILSLIFCDKRAEKLQKQVKISDSELEEYTALAYDLSEVNVGNISKILIQGKKQKISFVFPGSGKQTVTIDYSGVRDYHINSSKVTKEQIDSSVIVLNKLLNLNTDNFYRIEFDNAEKIISIQADSTSKGVFIVELSKDERSNRTLNPTKNTYDDIYIWEKGLPAWIIFATIITILYVLEQYLKKRNNTK